MNKLKSVVLIIVALIIYGGFISFANSDELYHYKAHGQNKKSGLVVAGQIWEADKNGTLTAKIWDEFEIQEQCRGSWVGYGVAQLHCENGIDYVLEVVED